MKKKILAALVVASMAFSLVACGAPHAKSVKAVKDLGFEEMDAEDVVDIDDGELSDYDDGVYTVTDDAKLIKKLIADNFEDFDKNDAVDLFTAAISKDEENVLAFYEITFTDEKTAKSYFEEVEEDFEDLYDEVEESGIADDAEMDSSKTMFQCALNAEIGGEKRAIRALVNLDGATLTIISCESTKKTIKTYDSMIEDYCEATGMPNPSGLI